jgi:hypothetical protein
VAITDESFYILDDAFLRGALRVSLVTLEPIGVGLLRGLVSPATAIKFRREVGRKPLDLVSATDAAQRLVSPATLAALLEASATGWQTYPVEIDPKGVSGSVAGYEGLAVTGRCGPIRKELARDARVPGVRPGQVRNAKVGMYFDSNTWDGSDVFMPGDRGTYVLITARVRDVLIARKLRNFAFTASAEFTFA